MSIYYSKPETAETECVVDSSGMAMALIHKSYLCINPAYKHFMY